MRLLTRCRRPRYADVAATVALFISLGGASYAALSLPPNSVGSAQLRSHAVTAKSLGIPLLIRGFDETNPLYLSQTSCPPSKNGTLSGDCQVILREGTPLGTLEADEPADVFLSALADIEDEGPPGTTTQVQLALFCDRQQVARITVEASGGERKQVPLQAVTAVPRGTSTVGYAADARYEDEGSSGKTRVESVSIAAIVLPKK